MSPLSIDFLYIPKGIILLQLSGLIKLPLAFYGLCKSAGEKRFWCIDQALFKFLLDNSVCYKVL